MFTENYYSYIVLVYIINILLNVQNNLSLHNWKNTRLVVKIHIVIIVITNCKYLLYKIYMYDSI